MDLGGRNFAAEPNGRITIPVLRAGETLALLPRGASEEAKRWYEERGPAWLADFGRAAQKIHAKLLKHA
jgi:hypothetical protein